MGYDWTRWKLVACLGLCFVFPVFAETERHEMGNLVIEGVPEIPVPIQEGMLPYQNTRSASLQGWLPNGLGMLLTTRFGETNQVHVVKQPGGAREQLTFFPEPVQSARPSPSATAACFIFSKDLSGSEFYQLFLYPLKSRRAFMITDGKSRNGSVVWNNRGDRFAFHSTRRNGRDYDIYLGSLEKPDQPETLLQTEGLWNPLDWSPDDKMLLLHRYVSINESYLYSLNLETRQLAPINPSDEKIAYDVAKWSKDGKGIYLTSDQNSEFVRLRYYDSATRQMTGLTEAISWDIEGFDLSHNGSYLAFVANEDGISRLHVLNLQTRQETNVPPLPVGVMSVAFQPDGMQLGLTISTPQTPGDVYVLSPTGEGLDRWTYSEAGGLDTNSFVVPERIHYPTFDSTGENPRQIPAFYYKPSTPREDALPVLITIHGGPESQFRPTFNPYIQYFVNELGMAVIAPNVRGSAGYGKQYLQLDNWQKREDTVKDIGALLDWIAQQRELDPQRVVVMGGSYGGYMVLASMMHYNDRLMSGIEIVGISNFVTFLENTQEYRKDLRRQEYGDERVPEMREFLLNISPLTHTERITKPMLIAQGLNDPRVPVEESEQIVNAIRNNGGNVWYILAKDEGHGFQKKSNRDYFYEAAVLFLERFLLSP